MQVQTYATYKMRSRAILVARCHGGAGDGDLDQALVAEQVAGGCASVGQPRLIGVRTWLGERGGFGMCPVSGRHGHRPRRCISSYASRRRRSVILV